MATEEISRARKLVADAGMVGTAAIGTAALFVKAGAHDAWPVLPFAAAIAVSGLGLTRGSIITRVLARGAAWAVLFPAGGYVLLTAAGGGMPSIVALGAAATTAIALGAAAPALGTRAMRAEFAPTAGRRWFLTGATAASTAGIFSGLGALVPFMDDWASIGTAVMFATLAAGYLGSVYGLLKMRGWSVLLGGITALALLALSFLDGQSAAPGWIFGSLTLLAGILAPVALARVGALRHQPTGLRVATDGDAHARVDLGLDLEAFEVDDEPEPARRAARP